MKRSIGVIRVRGIMLDAGLVGCDNGLVGKPLKRLTGVTTFPRRYQYKDYRMRLEKANFYVDKGWYFGPWNSDMAVSIGYANAGIDQPHLHTRITEIYLVAKGSAEIRVEKKTFSIAEGDVIAIEPGEAHTFLSNSPDYFHFVIHTPGLAGEVAREEKIWVSRDRLET